MVSNKKRRHFFNTLLGKAVEYHDKVVGKKNLPLDRLHELPNRVILNIIPVFFEDTDWRLQENSIVSNGKDEASRVLRHLTEEELVIFSFFNCGFSLDYIAKELAEQHQYQLENLWDIVSGLFFDLARLRICHPHQEIDFDQFL